MRQTVRAIALGKLSTIPERLHAVRRARELTEASGPSNATHAAVPRSTLSGAESGHFAPGVHFASAAQSGALFAHE